MNRLETRLGRLEAKAPANLKPWERVIWDPECETLEEAKARDLPTGYDGNLIIVRIFTPESARKTQPPHE